MINKYLSFLFLLITCTCSINAGTSINQETIAWIQETAPRDAQAIIQTLDHTLINNDYRQTHVGTNQPLIFYNIVNGKKEAAGIVKYVDKASRGLTELGVYPSEQAARERFAFLLQETLKEKTGFDFGVPLTLMLKMPHAGSTTGNFYIASFQKFIWPHIVWRGTPESEINKIPQEEFQKLIFHVILESTDAHKDNILLFPIKDKNGKSAYTPILIDLSANFPRSATKGPLRSLYGWMMYRAAQQPFTSAWKKQFESLDIASVLDTMQLKWQKETEQFGDAAKLPEEIWDLLTVTLHTVKYGAKYNQTLQTMASIFAPIKTTSKQGAISYVGGEIELLIQKYFDPTTQRWVKLGEALEEVEEILSGSQPRRIQQKTRFPVIEWNQIQSPR